MPKSFGFWASARLATKDDWNRQDSRRDWQGRCHPGASRLWDSRTRSPRPRCTPGCWPASGSPTCSCLPPGWVPGSHTERLKGGQGWPPGDWSSADSPVRYAKFESIRYFIDIDILQNCLIDIDIDIDIFQNHHIDIDIFGIALSISIFSKMTISILISITIFFKSVDISTIDMSYRYIEQG